MTEDSWLRTFIAGTAICLGVLIVLLGVMAVGGAIVAYQNPLPTVLVAATVVGVLRLGWFVAGYVLRKEWF